MAFFNPLSCTVQLIKTANKVEYATFASLGCLLALVFLVPLFL